MPDYERAARYLFDILDDIDSAGDMWRDNYRAYRNHVELLQHKRFDVATVEGPAGERVVFK